MTAQCRLVARPPANAAPSDIRLASMDDGHLLLSVLLRYDHHRGENADHSDVRDDDPNPRAIFHRMGPRKGIDFSIVVRPSSEMMRKRSGTLFWNSLRGMVTTTG